MENLRLIIARNITELRREAGLTQLELAEKLNYSDKAVSKWERAESVPDIAVLKAVADLFGVTVDELIRDKDDEEIFVSKNKTIDQQKKALIGFAAGCMIGLFILAFIFIEPLRDVLELIGLGAILSALGIFNMCGNIGSIHWYNRRKVAKEDQKIYCLIVGLGTLIVGVGLIAAGIVQALVGVEESAFIMVVGILVGLVLILYAQFKYNRGLF